MDALLDPALAPAEIERRFEESAARMTTPCGDGELVWRLWGAGPPLLLLHGGSGSWRHWIRSIDVLGRRFRLYVPDMPGLGDSADAPAPYTAESLAAILSDGLDRVLPPPVRLDIAGFSFGGLLGGHVAALQGARIDRLVLIAPGGLGFPRASDRPKLAKLRRDMSAAAREAAHRRNLEIIMFGDPERIDALALHLQAENVRRARTKSPPIAVTDTLARALPRVRAGIKAIYGDRDRATGDNLPARRQLLESIQPGLDFRIIPGAGHWVMYETPDTLNALLLDMLPTTPGDGANGA